MTFGYSDGTDIKVDDCDIEAICDGDTCYQLFIFDKDTDHKNTFILDNTKKKRDLLFNYVKERYG